MRFQLVLLAGVLWFPSVGLAQTAADSVLRLDSAWARSYAVHDTALAGAVFSDSLVVTSTSGAVKNKQGEIADVRAQAGLQMHYFRTEQPRVRLYPGTGIVTGIASWQFTYNGQLNSVRRAYTSVFVRGGPLGWQMVALHIGRAPDAAPAR
jgi:hypothetical protein